MPGSNDHNPMKMRGYSRLAQDIIEILDYDHRDGGDLSYYDKQNLLALMSLFKKNMIELIGVSEAVHNFDEPLQNRIAIRNELRSEFLEMIESK